MMNRVILRAKCSQRLRPAKPDNIQSRKYTTKPLRAIIFGPPGSGKGTQSEKIEQDYGLHTMSTGDLLRQAIADNTAIGQKVKPVIEKGNLVDDATMVELVKDTIEHDFKNKGWLLDGFPRTLPQADQLDAMLQATGKPLHLALMLDVPDELIIDRICNRWTHIPSGRVYHTSYKPPKVPGKDDVTGEPLTQRPDDTEARVRARLANYRKYTEPLLNYYKSKNILRSVTSKTSDEGYVVIKQILDDTLKGI